MLGVKFSCSSSKSEEVCKYVCSLSVMSTLSPRKEAVLELGRKHIIILSTCLSHDLSTSSLSNSTQNHTPQLSNAPIMLPWQHRPSTRRRPSSALSSWAPSQTTLSS